VSNDELFEDITSFLRSGDQKLEVISDEEIDNIILAFAQGRGEEGFYEEEIQTLLNWAIHVRVNGAILDLAVKGLVVLNTEESTAGSFTSEFGDNLTVMISERGREIYNKLDKS
jgi:hypothetical protein